MNIKSEIIQIIELSLGIQAIALDTLLIETYGAESTDIANIVVAVEQKYQVHIPESALPKLRTPQDFVHLVEKLI